MANRAMIDYPTIQNSIKLTVGEHSFLLRTFEDKVRDILSADLSNIFTNSVSYSTLQNSIQSSLEHTSRVALREFEATQNYDFKRIADQLWNPLTATLSKLSMKESSTKVKTVHDSKAFKSKSSSIPIPADTDVRSIRERLRSVCMTRPVLYKNDAHRHVRCAEPNCRFCKDVFLRINPTKCVGHRPCHASGFYPHVGTALWSMLRNRHNKGQRCTLPLKPAAAHELPALLEEDALSEHSDVTITTDGEVTELETLSAVMSSPKRRRPSSPQSVYSEPLNWAEDVETYARRTARAASTGPSS